MLVTLQGTNITHLWPTAGGNHEPPFLAKVFWCSHAPRLRIGRRQHLKFGVAETLSQGKKPYTTSEFHQVEPENDNFQKDDPVPWGQVSGSMLAFFKGVSPQHIRHAHTSDPSP